MEYTRLWKLSNYVFLLYRCCSLSVGQGTQSLLRHFMVFIFEGNISRAYMTFMLMWEVAICYELPCSLFVKLIRIYVKIEINTVKVWSLMACLFSLAIWFSWSQSCWFLHFCLLAVSLTSVGREDSTWNSVQSFCPRWLSFEVNKIFYLKLVFENSTLFWPDNQVGFKKKYITLHFEEQTKNFLWTLLDLQVWPSLDNAVLLDVEHLTFIHPVYDAGENNVCCDVNTREKYSFT